MAALNIRGEAEWQRLKTHLEWSQGFLLGFIFSQHPRVAETFRERLADLYRIRITRLQEWQVEHPEQLQGFIPRLLEPTQREQALKDAPIWLDLSRLDKKGETRWRDARADFLSRLNEQREPLRRRQDRPVVLILPANERAKVKELTPDLWAIRTFCLDTENWVGALPARPPPANPPSPRAFPLSAYEQQLVDEWGRLCAQYQGRGKAAAGKTPALLQAGFHAFDALYGKRQLEEAQQVAETCLQAAREAPEALRDLSVSLNNVGKTAQALGRFEEARAAFDESLAIRRQILQRVGETPEALRDLSVSLNNVGKTAQALGRFEDARAAFDESLAIRRQILQRVGETPEALRDLCVSLSNLAAAALALGELARARAALEEGLEIGRRLAAAFPGLKDYNELQGFFRRRLRALEAGATRG